MSDTAQVKRAGCSWGIPFWGSLSATGLARYPTGLAWGRESHHPTGAAQPLLPTTWPSQAASWPEVIPQVSLNILCPQTLVGLFFLNISSLSCSSQDLEGYLLFHQDSLLLKAPLCIQGP